MHFYLNVLSIERIDADVEKELSDTCKEALSKKAEIKPIFD
jgi:hypothetical protein